MPSVVNYGHGWDHADIFANERHRSLRRLPSGRVRHALFHKPVRQLLRGATRNPMIARAILLDDNALKDFLDNLEIKKVLNAVHRTKLKRKLDFLGMDACLMSMAEVGYQIRDQLPIDRRLRRNRAT